MNVRTAADRLKLSPRHITRLCVSGQIKARKVPDRASKTGDRWEIEAESIEDMASENAGCVAQKEIEDHQKEQRRVANEFDLEKLINDLFLNKEQAARLRAASSIPKKHAEAILKAEQALERQNKNLLQSKNVVSLEELQEHHDRIFSVQFQNLKDMVETFITKFMLSPGQAAEARVEFENVMRRTCDELRAISK